MKLDCPWIHSAFDITFKNKTRRKKTCQHVCKDKSNCSHGKCCLDEYNGREEDIVEFIVTKRDGSEETVLVVIGEMEENDEDSWWEQSEKVKERTVPQQEKRVQSQSYLQFIGDDSEDASDD